jgi:carboxyl-terminal processing protease
LKKEFKTKNGRKVYDGGGVDPDIVIGQKKYSKIAESLITKQLIFDFATNYRTKHEVIAEPRDFKLGDQDFETFKQFIASKDYDYTTNTEKALDDLKKKADDENYFAGIKSEFELLKQHLAHDKQADLDKNKGEILRLLEEDILRRYYFQKSRYEYSFRTDDDIREAVQVLQDQERYKSILTARK